jgi:hypothetical protein
MNGEKGRRWMRVCGDHGQTTSGLRAANKPFPEFGDAGNRIGPTSRISPIRSDDPLAFISNSITVA